MAVYTKNLGSALAGIGQYAVVFSAPLGQVTIIRDVIFYRGAGASGIAQLYYETPGGDLWWLAALDDLAPGRTAHFDMRQVIVPGSDVWLYSPVASTMVTLTGYQFAG